jgi:hypothetical protein
MLALLGAQPITGIDLIFQLFALLPGLSIAELLSGLGRSWRTRTAATRTGARIRIVADGGALGPTV